jgi:hypothetical protein
LNLWFSLKLLNALLIPALPASNDSILGLIDDITGEVTFELPDIVKTTIRGKIEGQLSTHWNIYLTEHIGPATSTNAFDNSTDHLVTLDADVLSALNPLGWLFAIILVQQLYSKVPSPGGAAGQLDTLLTGINVGGLNPSFPFVQLFDRGLLLGGGIGQMQTPVAQPSLVIEGPTQVAHDPSQPLYLPFEATLQNLIPPYTVLWTTPYGTINAQPGSLNAQWYLQDVSGAFNWQNITCTVTGTGWDGKIDAVSDTHWFLLQSQ